jgi:hypothetical protein
LATTSCRRLGCNQSFGAFLTAAACLVDIAKFDIGSDPGVLVMCRGNATPASGEMPVSPKSAAALWTRQNAIS